MKDELERAYYQRAHRDNENFALVWLLKQYYENTIFGSFYTTYLSQSKLKSELAMELQKLFLCAKNTAGSLKTIGCSTAAKICSSPGLQNFSIRALTANGRSKPWNEVTEPFSFD